MKILVLSDLHTEFWKGNVTFSTPDEPYDVVVAAGDIGLGTNGVEFLLEHFDKPIVYVPGNHEYYRHNYQQLQKEFDDLGDKHPNLHMLNPGVKTIGDYTFIGATLWTDCKLDQYTDLPPPYYVAQIQSSIADFSVIEYGERTFRAADAINLYNDERMRIENALNDYDPTKCIVVTHFVPSQLLIDARWLGPKYKHLNPYFTNDLDDLMEQYKYPVHIYGHTHDRNDLVHPSGTRLVGNPFGYPGENQEKYQWKIIEV